MLPESLIRWSITLKVNMSLKSTVRNRKHLPIPKWRIVFFTTSIKDINTKLSGYLPWALVRNQQRPPIISMKDSPFGHTLDKTRSYVTSRVTVSSKCHVRNHICPLSSLLKKEGSRHTTNWIIGFKFSKHINSFIN